jgi:uncharacterized membrane protein YqaE (UPF0057 family)
VKVNFWRILLAFIFPPLAVLDKGCGTASLVFVLTALGWLPGVIVALLILSLDSRDSRRVGEHRFVEVSTNSPDLNPKRKGAFITLEDGEIAEVVEDDGAPLEKWKRGG